MYHTIKTNITYLFCHTQDGNPPLVRAAVYSNDILLKKMLPVDGTAVGTATTVTTSAAPDGYHLPRVTSIEGWTPAQAHLPAQDSLDDTVSGEGSVAKKRKVVFGDEDE